MYRCCIFDLDGTLVNSIYAIQRSVNQTLESFGYPPISVEDTKKYVGDGYKKLMEGALKAQGDEALVHYQESLEKYSAFFKECCLYRVEPYEGIKELLEFLKGRGIKIAVLSNKPHARAMDNIDGVFGPGYFDWASGERESEGIPRKPAPEGVWACAKELGVSMEECLYLGDTNTDMKTGLAAGAVTVGVTWGFRGRAELEAFSPAYIVDHPQDVIRIVKDVNGIEES